jgi:hypothetical protein
VSFFSSSSLFSILTDGSPLYLACCQNEMKIYCGIFLSLIDHVQLTAISQALKVNLNIAYLDGRSEDGRVEYVKFNHASDANEAPITLIYR